MGGMVRGLAFALWQSIRGFVAHDGVSLAGYIAYSGLLALFPFVIFLAGLAALVGEPAAADRFIALSADFLPAEVALTLAPIVAEVLAGSGATVAVIVLSLWAASSGVEALRSAVDRAYGAKRTRPFWLRRLQGLAFVAAASLAAIFAMTAIVIAPLVWDFVTSRLGTPPGAHWLWLAARYALAALALFAVFLLFYRWLPSSTHHWRWHAPGAVFACLLWLGLATSYSLYLEQVGGYRLVYGSLGGIVATLFFFFLSAAVAILGAEFNAALGERPPHRRIE